MGNPKKKSRFICIHCMAENYVGSGIQRGGKQREKNHIKDLLCLNKGCGFETKNLEVRYCDDYLEMLGKAQELHEEYYGMNKEVVRV